MIYGLIVFTFITNLVVAYLFGRKQKNGIINKCNTTINDTKFMVEERVLNTASNAFADDLPSFVPECVIDAKQKGYIGKGVMFRYCGQAYKYNLIYSASHNEIVVRAEILDKNRVLYMPDYPYHNITIYKNGLWRELEVISNKSETTKDSK